MYRYLACVMALMMVGFFCGCGGSGQPAPSEPAAKAVKTPAPEQKTASNLQEFTPETPEAEEAEESAPAEEAAEDTAENKSTGPRIMSPEPIFDFGERDAEEKVEHAFVIKNIGAEQLEIKNVRTSCGCTVAQPEKKSLAPGEETRVPATLSLKGRQGPQTKTITIESNDKENPMFKLEFKGSAVAAISVEPRTLNFGRVSDDESKSEKIRVWATKPDVTFAVESVDLVGAEQVKAELQEVHAGKEYALQISLQGPLTPGNLNARITLKTDYKPYETIPLTVFAIVVGDLDIAPNELTLRFSEEPDKKSTQYLRVSPGRVKEFKITNVETPIPGLTAEIQERSANDYLIKVIDMPLDGSLEGKELLIHTDVETMPLIRVPFKIVRIPALRAAPSAIGGAAKDGTRRQPPIRPPSRPQRPNENPAAASTAAPANAPAPSGE